MKQLLLIFALLLFTAAPVFAQTTNASALKLTTSPIVVNLSTTPGQAVSTDVKVENTGSSVKHIALSLMKFSANGDTGAPQFMKRQSGDDYFDWVTFSANSFDLAPNEWKTVKVTFNVPKTAAYGYYYAITFGEKGAKAQASTAAPVTSLEGASAILVLLNVQVPGEEPQLQVASFTTAHNFYEFLPAQFNVLVKNTGNIHVVPQGSIFITRPNSNTDLSVISLNEAQGTILPQTSRLFAPDWTDGFPVSTQTTNTNGKTETHLSWDLNQAGNFRWGAYQAHLIMVYNNGTRDVPIEGTLAFWVIPWKFALGGVIIVLLVLVGLGATVRNLFRKARHVSSRQGRS